MLDDPEGVAPAPNGDALIADSDNNCVRRVSSATGRIVTIAGICVPFDEGDRVVPGFGPPGLPSETLQLPGRPADAAQRRPLS
jgi:NHL repeat-containing protein